jgi:hypothetical protein
MWQDPSGHEHPAPHCVPALVVDAVHAVQTLLRQKAVAQSARLLHRWPILQRGQSGPPQSTSLSLPFWIPSLQVAGIGAGGMTTVPPVGSGVVWLALCFLAFLRHFFLASPSFFLHFFLASWAAVSSVGVPPRSAREAASSPPSAWRREPAAASVFVRVSNRDPSMRASLPIVCVPDA